MVDLESQLENTETGYKKAKSEFENQQKISKEAKDQLFNLKNRLDHLNNQYKENFADFSSLKETVQQKKYELSWHHDQIANVENENRGISEILHELNITESKLLKQKNEFLEKRALLSQNLSEITTQKEKLQEKQKNLEILFQKHTHITENLKEQRSFYKTVVSSYQGHPESTRLLMKVQDRFPDLKGPLVDIIKITNGMSHLLEIALGDAVHFLVVESVSTTNRILDYVHQNHLDRVTIVPLERIKRIEPSLPISPDSGMKRLTDFVKCDKEYVKIIQLLIGDVFLVETRQQALKFAEEYPELKFINNEGELIGKTYSISAGQAGDPRHNGREYERRDNHLERPDKQVLAQEVQPPQTALEPGGFGIPELEHGKPDRKAYAHADQDPVMEG